MDRCEDIHKSGTSFMLLNRGDVPFITFSVNKIDFYFYFRRFITWDTGRLFTAEV